MEKKKKDPLKANNYKLDNFELNDYHHLDQIKAPMIV